MEKKINENQNNLLACYQKSCEICLTISFQEDSFLKRLVRYNEQNLETSALKLQMRVVFLLMTKTGLYFTNTCINIWS